MKTTITARVGADGVLELKLALGQSNANKYLRVSVETMEETQSPTAPTMTHEQWLEFIDQTAGAITDPTFERHPQGDYEERDPL